jgi:hypothetical protein
MRRRLGRQPERAEQAPHRLVNDRVLEDHAAYGVAPNPRHLGVPHPGTFILDAAGIVVDKYFHESYRERDTAGGLAARVLGRPAPLPAATVAKELGVQVRAWLDSPGYAFFQRVHLEVEIHTGPGQYVCAAPAPPGVTPLSIDVAPLEGVVVGAGTWAAAEPIAEADRGMIREGYGGTVRGVVPLTFSGHPGTGDRVIRAVVRFQVWREGSLRPPAAVLLELSIQEWPLVGRALPGRPSAP